MEIRPQFLLETMRMRSLSMISGLELTVQLSLLDNLETCVSTAIPSCLLKTAESSTLAVFLPTPSSFRRSVMVRGSCDPKLSTISREEFRILAAFRL